MRKGNYRHILICIAVCLIGNVFTARAQSVTGKWYGIGNPDIPGSSNSYLCEFIITQNGSNVTGYFNYFFRNGYFSNKLVGRYDASKRLLVLKPLPILYHLSANVGNGVDCIMTGVFKLKVAKVESTLSGEFLSDELHKYTSPPVKVNFRKLGKDEPELKERIKMKDLVLEEAPEVQTQAVPAQQTTAPAIVSTQPTTPLVLPSPTVKATEDAVKMRTNTYIRILDVVTDSVDVDLYDNGDFDADSISIFYNNKLIAHRQELSTRKPISLRVFVDSIEKHNDLLMFAENLGTIPPNSAIMIVKDGSNRYEIPLQSNYQKNGAVRLRKVQRTTLAGQ
ncbi:hypothetical protein FC093_15745 [Ilyomonas limi]|uniref:Uncharacterized protein n=1 Tax=Ilyomonas limi TaxID=2575867 RepID=A0A4U3KX29_9BACT|nr:hypothetical protein [Ilyomonas limi]TKK66952.1 hypothetical protein FC093_15745 [Ilyomonas limi]